jgi:hypothetical protein
MRSACSGYMVDGVTGKAAVNPNVIVLPKAAEVVT